MPLMLMSNPGGLHLALLGNPRGKSKKGFPSRKRYTQAVWKARRRVGKTFKIKGGGAYRIKSIFAVKGRTGRPRVHAHGISWSGRKGGISYRGTIRRAGHRRFSKTRSFTNPSYKRNPMKILNDYVGALKGAPGTVMSTVKGGNKAKNLAFMGAGAIGSFILAGTVVGIAKKVPGVGSVAGNPIGARLLTALGNFTVGYAASKFIKGDAGKAILAGSIVSAVLAAAKPDLMDGLIAKIPVIGPMAAKAKAGVSGLAGGLLGYVDAPSYQGVGGYVDAPSYQGVGGYVDAPSYQGVGEDALASDALANLSADDAEDVGNDTALAGLDGYLTEAAKFQKTYLD